MTGEEFYALRDDPILDSVAEDHLEHMGVLGMHWGQRRYQNADGSLTPLGRIHYGRRERSWKRKGYMDENGMITMKGYRKLSAKDEKWATKNHDKIYKYALKKARKEMADYRKYTLNREMADQIKGGKVSKTYINAYNKKLAEVLTEKIGHIKTPNLEKTISFINKRGELGAYMAVSDKGYDLSQFKQGIHRGGRVAYRKNVVNQISAK